VYSDKCTANGRKNIRSRTKGIGTGHGGHKDRSTDKDKI